MVFGQTIRAPLSGAATYFSPWFPRQGSKAVFACNLIASAGVDTLEITVETKKPESDNTAANILDVAGGAASISLTADSTTPFERGLPVDGTGSTQGFLQLVRFKYVLTSDTDFRGWVHFRMLNTTWDSD